MGENGGLEGIETTLLPVTSLYLMAENLLQSIYPGGQHVTGNVPYPTPRYTLGCPNDYPMALRLVIADDFRSSNLQYLKQQP